MGGRQLPSRFFIAANFWRGFNRCHVSEARQVWRCLRMPGSQSRSDGEVIATLWALPELAICTAGLFVFAPLPPILRPAMPAPYWREPRKWPPSANVGVGGCMSAQPWTRRNERKHLSYFPKATIGTNRDRDAYIISGGLAGAM